MAKTNYETVKDWRKRNPDKVAAQAVRYRKRHPETSRKAALKHRHQNIDRIREQDAERVKTKRRSDPEGQRARVAKFKAKKEAERVAIAGRQRPSVCDICSGNHHLGIVFDHCHRSGKFRGWLCDRCNKVLGSMKDDPKILRKMARYLEKHRYVEADDHGKEFTFFERICRAGS
jgi:hypothetical protein